MSAQEIQAIDAQAAAQRKIVSFIQTELTRYQDTGEAIPAERLTNHLIVFAGVLQKLIDEVQQLKKAPFIRKF